MGIIHKIGKALGLARELNIEEFMSAAEAEEVDVLHQAADFYVKPIALESESDITVVQDELRAKNIILLNITPLAKNAARLKSAVAELKNFVTGINGDIARVDEEKLLLTPANVKIVKKRRAAA